MTVTVVLFSEKSNQLDAAKFFTNNKHEPQIIKNKINQMQLRHRSGGAIFKAFSKQAGGWRKTVAQEPVVDEAVEEELVVMEQSEQAREATAFPKRPAPVFSTRPAPKQTEVEEKISELNRDIADVSASGLLTDDDPDVMKLHSERKKLFSKLQQLRGNQQSSRRRREKTRRILLSLKEDPRIGSNINVRARRGRPRLEEDQPLLLTAITDIVLQDSATHERRRCEQLRKCKTVAQLQDELLSRGN